MKKDYILFIDSGIGGLSTLAESSKSYNGNYIYYADNTHCPYGLKSRFEITEYLTNIIKKESQLHNIKMVVLACNTATTNSINQLRATFNNIKLIGTEPALMVAKTNNHKKILVLTTPATASQTKYLKLVNLFDGIVATVAIDSLAQNIEQWFTQQTYLNYLKLLKNLYYIKQKSINYDCVVLGCTHYIFIKNWLSHHINCPLYDGNFGVAKQIKSLGNGVFKNLDKSNFIFRFSLPKKGLKQKYIKIFKQILAN